MKFSEKYLTILTVFISICFILNILFVFNSSFAGGYEISIYNSYPSTFWFILFLIIIISEIIIILYVYSNNIKIKYLFVGLIGIIASYYLIIAFPIIKGYIIFGRADVLSHIGFMNDILNTDHISLNDIYPLMHISGIIFSMFSSFDLYTISKIFPPLISLYSILISYIFSKIIFKNIKITLFSLIFITIPVYQAFHNLFVPYEYAFCLLPLVFFLYFKSLKSNFSKNTSFLFILFCSFILFSHPLIGLLLISIFIAIEISYIMYAYISHFKNNINISQLNIYIIIILSLIFLIWRTYFYIVLQTVEKMYLWITESEGTSQLQSYINLLNYANVSIPNIIILVLNLYGQWIIMGIISLISIMYLIFFKKGNITYLTVFLTFSYLFFTFISFIIFIMYQEVGFERFYIIVIIYSTFLITSLFYPLIKKILNYRTYIKLIFMIIILVTITSINYFSIFNIYYSPIIKSPNQQVAYSELTGMKTFFEFRNQKIEILELGISVFRFHNALYGNDVVEQNIIYDQKTIPLAHFGYNKYASFSDSYKNQVYLVINKLAKISDPSINPNYEDLWKYNDDDFIKIKNDFSVNLIYMNGNIEEYINLYK